MREEVLTWFSTALSRVGEPYFNLETIYNPAGIIRERVFCYELYHQLRSLQGNHPALSELTLNAEVDKRGHPVFIRFPKNPDFVFHKPGQMERNTSVVEVKGKLESAKVRKDFCTLLTFIGRFEYRFGIFILYNKSIGELKYTIQPFFESLPYKRHSRLVDILVIERSHQIPIRTTLQRIVEENTHAH